MSSLNPMADFNPTSRTVEPPNRPDQMAEAVLASLSRGRWGYKGRPWGVVKTVFLSYFTLGLAPLICWPKRMRAFMSSEQQQLWQLAEWLRLRTGKPEAVALRDEAAADIGPSPALGFVHVIILAFSVLALVRLIALPWFNITEFWDVSWTPNRHRYGLYKEFLSFWSILLSAGYLSYWLHVVRHSAMLERFVSHFNAITASEGLDPVKVPPLSQGLELTWLVAAIVGLISGAIWAIPLAMAGAVQTRYVWVTSRQTRADLSRRVRTMLDRTRPALDVRTTPRASALPCPNEKCHAPLRPGTKFCPRCGTRIV